MTAGPAPSAAVAAQNNDGLAGDRWTIDVCICTYHRPSIVETLRAIAAQEGRANLTLRVVVADNAVEPDARAVICAAGEAFGLDLVYVHAPARNISIARNACLAEATADWLAFLDDDECPSPVWLMEAIAEARRGNWDAVLGPVQALYPDASPAWIRYGDFHSTRPVWVRGRIETGYTSNVLVRREIVERAGLRFRVEYGRTGGEDLDFFYRLRDAGGQIGFAPKALIHEPVPSDRAELGYLLRRNFRQGQSHGTRLQGRGRRRFGVVMNLQIALAKAFVLGIAAACQPKTIARNRCLTRAALHCGVAARLAGLSEIQLY